MTGIYKATALRVVGSADAWTAQNPILENGEIGVELDTHKAKMGDGQTAWNTLAYIGAASATPAVTSVAGKTGAVTLVAADVSGVATPTSVSAQITAAAPVAATTGTAGLVKKMSAIADASGWTDSAAQTAFNGLLAAMRTAGLM